MTQLHVYRGVTYTKNDDQNTHVKLPRKAKIYRGVTYTNLAKAKHVITDHIYRGSHYSA